jgi:hypothetical protein
MTRRNENGGVNAYAVQDPVAIVPNGRPRPLPWLADGTDNQSMYQKQRDGSGRLKGD